MKHEESNLQQECVASFRAEYPQFAMLLIHPINEGSGHTEMDRRRQGIHKAEGAVAGAPDLLFFLPSYKYCPLFPVSIRKVEEYVKRTRPSLQGRNITIAFSNNRVY